MATSPIVYEVMIHCADADAGSAALLQQQLQKDGIRAGIAGLCATNEARHSLRLIGDGFNKQDLAFTEGLRFDSTLISPRSSLLTNRSALLSSYEMLLNRLTSGHTEALISAAELQYRTRASYDAIAAQFTDVWFDHVPGEAIETFIKHLPQGATILDAGCGPGHHTQYFQNAGFKPVGLDFSRGMLDIAEAKTQFIPFHLGDILYYALPKNHFEAVWSAVMLNHIPKEYLTLALQNLVTSIKWKGYIGLNFQVGRPSEIVSRGKDHRFFEYPSEVRVIIEVLESLGVRIIETGIDVIKKNTHGLNLEMKFATVVGQKSALERIVSPRDH